MKNLTGPVVGLHFKRHNSVVIDTTHVLIHFPHSTMKVKSALSQTSVKPQAVLIHDRIILPQLATKTITAFVDYLSEWNTTRTVTPVEKFTETESLIISHSMSIIIDRKIADSSQSNQHNGITLYNQQEHRNCRNLRSHSGAIQVYQTSRRGSP